MPSSPDPASPHDLYGLPLEDFTAERNRLARDLAKNGDREESDRVKAMGKPSRPAWIVNQLARRREREAADLLRAGEALREAQEKVLEGADREALDTAIRRERDAVGALAAAAASVSEEAGHNPSQANLDRVRSTLHAVSLDAEVRQRFEQGTLVEDRASTGLDELSLLAVPANRPKRGGGARKRPAKQKRKRTPSAAATRRLREAEAKEAQLMEEVEAARRDLRDAERRFKSLEAKLTRARAAAAKAREEL